MRLREVREEGKKEKQENLLRILLAWGKKQGQSCGRSHLADSLQKTVKDGLIHRAPQESYE